MSKIIKSFVFIFLFASASQIYAQKTVQPQTIFNLENKIQKPVALPDSVIAVLKSDRAVDGCFQAKGASSKESEWFGASEIDLNCDGRPDLIVKAEDACLYGANQAPFWIFQNEPDGYQKILTASGLELAVLPTKSNRFNRIKISRVVAMKPSHQIFSFRAGKYQGGK